MYCIFVGLHYNNIYDHDIWVNAKLGLWTGLWTDFVSEFWNDTVVSCIMISNHHPEQKKLCTVRMLAHG